MELYFVKETEMFNREVKVDLVKKSKSHENETTKPDIGFEKKAKIIGNILEEGTRKIGWFVCAYVVLDTVRKVAIASVTA